MNFGVDIDEYSVPIIQTPTVDSVLGTLGSGIGLDIAKNHTGVCIYRDGNIIREGFKLEEYNENDVHAEYSMRKDMKLKLQDLLWGLDVKHCIVEDVYGGNNFDTVRKLLALNTVIDELIDEGVVKVGNFYRWSETRWLKYFRRFYKIKGGYKSKIETQMLLEFLGDTFYLANRSKSDKEKKDIFFEDICDATAMLCSVSMYLKEEENKSENSSVSVKDIQMYYIESYEDYLSVADGRVGVEPWLWVEPDYRSLEKKVIEGVKSHPKDILIMDVPVSKLGRFGISNKFTFYPSGRGCLIWYLRHT